MFTIGQRLGCRERRELGPTRGPTGRADCNDSGAPADHHPGIHIEPKNKDRNGSKEIKTERVEGRPESNSIAHSPGPLPSEKIYFLFYFDIIFDSYCLRP